MNYDFCSVKIFTIKYHIFLSVSFLSQSDSTTTYLIVNVYIACVFILTRSKRNGYIYKTEQAINLRLNEACMHFVIQSKKKVYSNSATDSISTMHIDRFLRLYILQNDFFLQRCSF